MSDPYLSPEQCRARYELEPLARAQAAPEPLPRTITRGVVYGLILAAPVFLILALNDWLELGLFAWIP